MELIGATGHGGVRIDKSCFQLEFQWVSTTNPTPALSVPEAIRFPGSPSAPLEEALMAGFAIEVPVFPWPRPPLRTLRISAQLYNSTARYRRLAEALDEIR